MPLTLERALAERIPPEQLRAVANWNSRGKRAPARRRRQAEALRKLADEIEHHNKNQNQAA